MDRNVMLGTIAAAVVALSLSCSSNPSTPSSTIITPSPTPTPTPTPTPAPTPAPTPTPTPTPTPIPLTPTPTITAPTTLSPVGNQVATSLVTTFTATTAAVSVNGLVTTLADAPLTAADFVLKYRFQVFDDAGLQILDSGLVSAPTWTAPVALTPLKRHTWRVRAESQGFAGPWSATASFSTPEQPPTYNRPIGDWQSCASQAGNKAKLVQCVWNAVLPNDSPSDMEVVKRVAWLLRGEGAGLLIKPSGDGWVLWQGYQFSISRICYPDGHIYKILSDAGPNGVNGPIFSDNDFVDKALYVPAIDPAKP
jgi:hypothetical protein